MLDTAAKVGLSNPENQHHNIINHGGNLIKHTSSEESKLEDTTHVDHVETQGTNTL